ncbi:hypothetical protein QFC24_005393 [Naganishia onofrii]|uniref:Uncharacterized protein n=1 Tax=Naganishia onofrii TaxID=1851511 RepID=A0ACC2X948_9TREE|nr:hypothetical protein QFC24_005393 [Naganishia onofrii]
MDLLTLVTSVAAYVQDKQLPVNRFIADNGRHVEELPDFVESMHPLLSDLADAVLGIIPLQAYASHYYSTLRLLEALESLEEGFARNVSAVANGKASRHDNSKEVLMEMMKAHSTDKQLAQVFKYDLRAIFRRRLELGLHRRASSP